MKKKQKNLIRKIFTILMFSAAGILVAAILFVVVFYLWDKHKFENKYHEALARCTAQPYVILSEINDGSAITYFIGKTDSSYHYQLITFDSVYGYACTAQQAKQYVISQYPGVPENDLDIQIAK